MSTPLLNLYLMLIHNTEQKSFCQSKTRDTGKTYTYFFIESPALVVQRLVPRIMTGVCSVIYRITFHPYGFYGTG